MRVSKYLLSTQKETPANAEVISHQLMLRAGMIRRNASGLYSWLPSGLRVLRKVEAIVREEMNKAGIISFDVVSVTEKFIQENPDMVKTLFAYALVTPEGKPSA